MKKHSSLQMIVLVVFVAATLLSSCNFPVYFQPRNTSFDEATLMMIASRANLGLYASPDEETASANENQWVINDVMMVSAFNYFQRGSKEQLNEQLALTAEFERLAAAAEEKGNQFLVNFYNGKAEEHRLIAEQVEKRRADWRRNRRFFYVIKKGARAFGHAIGNIIEFAANSLISNIKNQIDFYGNEIRSFLANPIRYTFDLSLTRQLEIIKNQLTSRLGPFFGQRAYDLLNVEQTAWNVERHLFVRKTQPSQGANPPAPAATAAPETAGETTAGGYWHGPDCGEAEGTDFQYHWSVELAQDPETDQYTGLIRFHACPDGGRAVYRVIGEPTTNKIIMLNGIIEGGRGDLYANSPETLTFKLNTKKGTISPDISH